MNKERKIEVIALASILIVGAISIIGMNSAHSETFDCTLQLNGKGCVIAQKAKDDIRNTINIIVKGNDGGGSGGGGNTNGTNYGPDIAKLQGDVTALQAGQTTQGNSITDLQSKDVQQDQSSSANNASIVALQAENVQLRTDLNKLQAEFIDFVNNGTQIVVLPAPADNSTDGGNTGN